jgi:two-component system copper resistance phosphate regulon response regulator CusR
MAAGLCLRLRFALKLLIIEDDVKAAACLQRGLTEHGFVVDTTDSGDEGLRYIEANHYDLIILDVLLPGRDGWSVVAALRQNGHQMPVLFLTACNSIVDRIKGLELGADDYVVKPFDFHELLARAHSLLRRAPNWQPQILQIADLEIDLTGHKALRRGQRLPLTPKEFLLLSLLARHAGQVLSRTRIAEQVWDMNFESDSNVVDVHVRRLRKKVDDPYRQKLIHTVRGVVYVLEYRA